MTKITYTSPDGEELVLLQPGDWVRAIAYGGLSGLSGSVATSSSQSVGVPGHTPTTHHTQATRGSLTLLLHAAPGESVEGLSMQTRRVFDSERPGTLLLELRGHPPRSAQVRLDGEIPPPPEVLHGAVEEELTIPLICDSGLWDLPETSASGAVTIDNRGDAVIWPTLVWTGPASVTLPSGSLLQLPFPAGMARLSMSLDPWTSHEITDSNAAVVQALSRQSARWLAAEGVPRKQSRTYVTSGAVMVTWRPQIRNPWRSVDV